jgi:Spy/CpxP family protein refolding chaperone
MKPWFKRSLLAVATVATVAGLSACGHGPMGGGQPPGDGPDGRGPMMGMRGGPMMGMHGGPMMGMHGGPMMGMHGGPRGPMSDADAAQMRDRMVARATQELTLDDGQKAKLVKLLDTMHQQRKTMMGAAGGPGMPPAPAAGGQPPKAPGEELLGLMKGERFDRAQAQALADQKANAMRSAAPDLITAMGDFYDSLKPEQQAKVRTFLAQGGPGRGMGRRGWHHG